MEIYIDGYIYIAFSLEPGTLVRHRHIAGPVDITVGNGAVVEEEKTSENN